MKNQNTVDEIYDLIIELKAGNEHERKLANKCIGILSDDSTTESYDNRLEMVSKLIENYYNKK